MYVLKYCFNSFPVDSDAFNFMSAKDKRIGNLNIKQRHKAAVRTSPNEQYLFFWYTEPLKKSKPYVVDQKIHLIEFLHLVDGSNI